MSSKYVNLLLLAAVLVALGVAAYSAAQVAALGSKISALESAISDLRSDIVAKLGNVSYAVGRLEERTSLIERGVAEVRNATSLLQRAAAVAVWDVPVRYARLFSIRHDGEFYYLHDALGRGVLLVPRGAPGDLVKFYVGKYKPDVVVKYPVERAVFMSSTQVAMAYRLYKEGAADVFRRTAGIMWGREYDWYLPEVAAMLENGTIKDVGSAYSPNYELLASLRPDVVFVFFYSGPYGTEAVLQRLSQLGIPYVVVNEFQESSPLGRAEWIKFIAAFFNKTDLAVKIFDGVEAKWNQLVAQVADLERPRVAWFIIYGGVLYPAGAGVRELIRLAGGAYAYANYSRVDMEVVWRHRNDVDVLIWSGYGVSKVEDLVKVDKRLAELRPVLAGRAYAYSKAFYQLANAYPEKLLEDLVRILHPEAAPPGNLTLFVHLS
ncbi:MAG: ABC transporter substrate-binding protein [Pyrobaculum sp.]